MSEESAGAESVPEGPVAGVDPVAMVLAPGGASQERADAFLKSGKAQFVRAAQLDLTPSEKSELAHHP